MNPYIKRLSRKRNNVFKRFKTNGYRSEDKVIVDRLRKEYQEAIVNAKENYFKNLGSKLADPKTGQKSYWKIMNKFLNKCKIPKIPPLSRIVKKKLQFLTTSFHPSVLLLQTTVFYPKFAFIQ